MSKNLSEQVIRTAKLILTGPVKVYKMTPIIGESTRKAYADAQAWLVSKQKSSKT